MQWSQTTGIQPKQFVCGFCGDKVASKEGYISTNAVEGAHAYVYVCPGCGKPSFIHKEFQSPAVPPGNEVAHLPADIAALYQEARKAAGASAHTAAVLACRKLLMNVAVAQGAKSNEPFITYVEYLAANGYVPPNGKGWVDHIRKKGNEATHEIQLMGPTESSGLVAFAEMLLKFIFEFPAKVPTSP